MAFCSGKTNADARRSRFEWGISNSKSLKIDEAKIEEATASYLEAKNRQLPDFKLSASALALANAKVDLKILPPSQGGGNKPKATSAFLRKCERFFADFLRVEG